MNQTAIIIMCILLATGLNSHIMGGTLEESPAVNSERTKGPGFSISTEDGLELSLAENGSVQGVVVDGVQLDTWQQSPFRLRDRTPDYDIHNLIDNGDFEIDTGGIPDGWVFSNYSASPSVMNITLDNTTSSSGNNSVRMHSNNTDGQDRMVCFSENFMDVSGNEMYVVTMFGKTEFGLLMDHWSYKMQIVVGFYNAMDNKISDRSFNVNGTVHDWRQYRWEFRTPEETQKVLIGIVHRGVLPGLDPQINETTVWFDDLTLYQLPPDENMKNIDGTLVMAGEDVVQTSGLVAEGLQLSGVYSSRERYLEISTTLTDTTGLDRAVDLSFGLPFNATGWTWYDDVRSSRPVKENNHYRNVVNADQDSWMPLSVYHTSALVSPDNNTGLALAISLGEPRIFNIAYNSSTCEFSITFCLGLSPLTEKFPQSANFTLYLYKIDEPWWGFRSSIQKYYELFPEHFTVKTPLGPDFFRFTRNSTGQYAPYGVRGQQIRSNSVHNVEEVRSANENNTYAAQYILPWSYEDAMGNKSRGSPSYDEYMEKMELYGRSDVTEKYKNSKACGALNGSCELENGEKMWGALGKGPNWAPDNWLGKFPQNLDPGLPQNSMAHIMMDLWVKLGYNNTKEANATLNGVECDCFMEQSAYLDQNKSRFQYVNHPLTYNSRTNRPAIHLGTTAVEFLSHLQDWMDVNSPNSSIIGNCMVDGIAMFGFPYLSSMPFEMNSENTWNFGDVDLNYRRTMARYRECTSAQCASMYDENGDVAMSKVYHYVNRALFYGMYPTYKEDFFLPGEEKYSSVLPLYQKAIPLVDELNDAGWEVMTRATSSRDGVYIERFGPCQVPGDENGSLYYTLYNYNNVTSTTRVNISMNEMGYISTGLNVVELWDDADFDWFSIDGNLVADVDITAEGCLVIKVPAVPITRDVSSTSISIFPAVPIHGEELTIIARLENAGNVFEENVFVEMYVDGIVTDNDALLLDSGQSANVEFTWSAVEGMHNISISADPNQFIKETNENNNLVFTLVEVGQAPGILRGKITDGDTGTGKNNVNLTLAWRANGTEYGVISTFLDGTYIFDSISEGEFNMSASCNGYLANYTGPIQVVGGETTWANLTLWPVLGEGSSGYGGIRGMCLDSDTRLGIGGVEITLLPIGMDSAVKCFTSPTGEYLLENVPVGTYNVSALHENYTPMAPHQITILEDLDLYLNLSLVPLGGIGDWMPPQVVQRWPAPDTTDVLVNTTIGVKFDEEVFFEKISLEDSIKVFHTDGISVNGRNIHDVVNRTLTFVPAQFLPHNATCKVIVGAGIQDVHGNSIAGDNWTFTTEQLGDGVDEGDDDDEGNGPDEENGAWWPWVVPVVCVLVVLLVLVRRRKWMVTLARPKEGNLNEGEGQRGLKEMPPEIEYDESVDEEILSR